MVVTLWMGIYPSGFTGIWGATATQMVTHHQAAPHARVALAAANR
jgi:hypothetical protein